MEPDNLIKNVRQAADVSQTRPVHFHTMESVPVNRKDQKHKLPPQADPDQAYHWSPAWEAGEREVDAELAHGRFTVYSSIDDMFDDMDRAAT